MCKSRNQKQCMFGKELHTLMYYFRWELYIYFMRFHKIVDVQHQLILQPSQKIMQFKNQVEIGKNLKLTRITTQKSGTKTLWIFQHSLYEIHIINISSPYPHHKICLHHPLQYFDVIQFPNHTCVIVVNNVGAWIAYDVQLQPKSKSLDISQVTQSMLESIENKIIGVHLIDKDKMMILFVKQTGRLQYNYLNTARTMRMNKLYSTQPSNQKYRNSNLFSQYRGRSLLQTEADNQNKILHSAYYLPSKELYVVTQDISSKVCSIFRFFLQEYEVIAGSDFLLNLDSRPVQMLVIDRIVVVNLGRSIVVWGRNLAEVEKYSEEGLCTSLTQVDKNTMMACISKVNQSYLYLITIMANAKQAKTLCNIKHQKLHTIPQQILHYTPLQPHQPNPSICLTNKLQIITYDKDNNQRIILSNMSATVLSAKMYSNQYSNYLDVVKKVGYAVQRKIVSNNRVVVGVDQYQHNMLIKMGTIVAYGVKAQHAILCLSSPIIGTIKLAVSFTSQNEKKQKISQSRSGISVSIANMESNLSTQEQSLFLNSEKTQQITPTKLSLPKSRYSISDMFEGKIDFILEACIVGNYALMAVEKQVHVFSIQPKPKRLHIYCLDHELRGLVSINDVNVWGAVLWDGCLLVLRIDEKESVKIKQINDVGLANNSSLQYNCVINTAPYRATILGHYLLICSNDPLHVYQSDRTSIRQLVLPSKWLGQQYYPLIQIPNSQSKLNNNPQKYKILCNRENMWMIVSFPLKCLVKDMDEIKIEVEMIVGLPTVDGLIAGFIRDSTVMLLSGTRIVVCGLQTGSIVYQATSTYSSLLPPAVNMNRNQYLQRWVDNQQVSVGSLKLDGQNPILSTNPSIIKLNQSRILIYNRKQIWYASMGPDSVKKIKNIKLISYFSIPNDAFLQFRNNLSISELENDAFMQIFAQKLPILEVSMINETLFAVLYSKMIVVVEIKNNGAMAIKQQLMLSAYPEIIAIKHFVGVYDELSLYMKDTSQRLILLRWDKKTNKYTLEILEEVEDEVVSIFKVHGWKDNIRKIGLKGDDQTNYEQIIVKKDGQLIRAGQTSQVYL